jgi:FkbH-like protein
MDSLKYSEILKQNAILAKDVENIPSYRINVLSNFTCNQLKDILEFNLRASKLNPEVKLGNYDNIIQESYNCFGAQLVIVQYDLINIIDKYPNFIEDFSEEQILSLFQTVKLDIDLVINNLQLIPAVVFNTFSAIGVYLNAVIPSKADLLARKLNEYLYSIKATNLHVLDINSAIAKVGLHNTFDFRMFYLSKSIYTISFWKEYVYELSTIVYRYTGKLKKIIIFDCDNTLWKGILGEDGMTGIDMSPQSKTGQIYNKIQQIAVWLSNQGILVALCSKNNSADVEKVMAEHPDMRLKKDHVVISKINWLDKENNLREIAKELNIGLDSFVFVDDSSFEVNLINQQVPEILTLQVPAALHEYPDQLLKLIERYFYLSGNTADIDKTKQYKVQSQRDEEKSKHHSLEDYLSSIGIEITIKENDATQVERIAQLTQKTNQFNLTTKRYTEKQIEIFMNSDKENVFSVSVSDKFGDSGLTAVCILQENNEIVSIDTFLMSCRIMGRNIEYAIMNYLVKTYEQRGFKIIESAYFPTIKNIPVTNFYDESGFFLVKQEETKKEYKLLISDYKPRNIEYIKIKC